MIELTPSQKEALRTLKGKNNVFLTGLAGSGKSFLIKSFIESLGNESYPVVASTGAAAILVGGCTFNSFFGLGIFERGAEKTIERALKNRLIKRRLKKTTGVIIDEISMISGEAFSAAEKVARLSLNPEVSWGGLRIIAVGDFSQLPPISRYGEEKDWAFLNPVWKKTNFENAVLTETVRTTDEKLISVLNFVRRGIVNNEVRDFLNSRMFRPAKFEETHLYAHRKNVEELNLERLGEIKAKEYVFETHYEGDEKHIENLKKNAPIPEVLRLKKGALVMFRQNDIEGRWVNGSLGVVCKLTQKGLKVEKLDGQRLDVDYSEFTLLDAEGMPVAKAINYPLSLAYALTIHKAQGATLDRYLVDLKALWEPGHSYVALSRAKDSSGVFVLNWSTESIKTSSEVLEFHSKIGLD